MKPTVSLAVALVAIAASGVQASNPPRPSDAQIVYCVASVGVGTEQLLNCRTGTGIAMSVVPFGKMLFVTDVVAVPNNATTGGSFSAILGRDDGSAFPATPSIDLLGSPTQTLRFRTPYVVLHAGEALAAANLAGSGFPIDVRVSGFVSGAYTAPRADPLFANGFEDP